MIWYKLPIYLAGVLQLKVNVRSIYWHDQNFCHGLHEKYARENSPRGVFYDVHVHYFLSYVVYHFYYEYQKMSTNFMLWQEIWGGWSYPLSFFILFGPARDMINVTAYIPWIDYIYMYKHLTVHIDGYKCGVVFLILSREGDTHICWGLYHYHLARLP